MCTLFYHRVKPNFILKVVNKVQAFKKCAGFFVLAYFTFLKNAAFAVRKQDIFYGNFEN